jgi:hypothetical protein
LAVPCGMGNQCCGAPGGGDQLARLWVADPDAFWARVGQGYDPAKLAVIREAVSCNVSGETGDVETDIDYLYNKRIGDAGARVLAAALQAMPVAQAAAVDSIVLEYNELTCAGMQALAPGLRRCTSMRTLYVSENAIGDAGFEALAKALPPTLTCLNLWTNKCGDAGMAALARALGPALEDLDFKDNQVGAAGFAALAKALPRWDQLETAIGHSNPGPATSFAMALATHAANKKMRQVFLHSAGLDDQAVKTLQEALKKSGCSSINVGRDAAAA